MSNDAMWMVAVNGVSAIALLVLGAPGWALFAFLLFAVSLGMGLTGL